MEQMEEDLEEIADGVRSGIGKMFERGEKFGTLLKKSEGLKSSVSFYI